MAAAGVRLKGLAGSNGSVQSDPGPASGGLNPAWTPAAQGGRPGEPRFLHSKNEATRKNARMHNDNKVWQ